MAVHLQLLQQQFQMAAALSTGCGASQAATLMQQIVPPTIFSGLENGVTCNVPSSRKRGRYEPPLPPPNGMLFQHHHEPVHQQLLLERQPALLLDQIHYKETQATPDLHIGRSRHMEAAMASTSGRPPFLAAGPQEGTSAAGRGYNDTIETTNASSSSSLPPMLHFHCSDVDALCRHRAEQLLSRLEVACKGHCREIIAAMEQQAQQRIVKKQAELEAAAKRNAELEEQLRQAASESHAWFDVARNSEALVRRLRASLEQALLHTGKNTNKGHCAPNNNFSGADEEGYGDSEEEAATAVASTEVTFTIP